MGLDIDKAQAFALHVWRFKQGEVISLMIHLGDRLGLYKAMVGGGPMTPADLASQCGTDVRWTEEWLLSQAAAEILGRTDDARYVLSEEAAAVLVDEESLVFAMGTFNGGTPSDLVDKIANSFRTGVGFTYGDMGPDAAAQIDRQNGPWLRHYLIPAVVTQIDGMLERLADGAVVIDVGCGGGVALQAFAEAFPRARLVGVDTSQPAVDVASSRLGHLPNVSVHAGDLDDLAGIPRADLVTTLDCMHDMARPDQAAAAIKDRLLDDGAWLIKDIKCGPTFESNARNPLLAMQYGFSVSSCLPSATSTPDGLGLGTMGFHPDRAREIVTAAGFSSFRQLPAEDPAHFYYEVRH